MPSPAASTTNETAPRAQSSPPRGRRLSAIPPSGTMEVGRTVRELRARGIDVIHLGGGSPEPRPALFGTPVVLPPEQNLTGDPAGDRTLRDAIAGKLARDQGLSYDAGVEIVVTVGAKQAIYTALLALIEPGEEVAIMDPAWVTYAPSVQLAGGVPRTFALDRARGFRLEPGSLRDVVGPRTRAVVVNTPHNPTGRVFTRDELAGVAAVAHERDLWVISDESFDKFVFDGRRHVSIAELPGMRDRTVVVQSFSKAYGLIGARIGYLAAPPEVAADVARFNEQVLSCVSPFVQSLALDALGEDPGWSERLRAHYHRKRELAVDAVSATRGLECAVPEGTFYVFADVSAHGVPSADFAARLLTDAHVAVTPGSAFGTGGEGFVRINLAGPLDTIREGLDRIKAALG